MEEKVLNALVRRGWVDQTSLDELQHQQEIKLEQARSLVAGTIYAIHPAKGMLIVIDALSGETLREVPLGNAAEGKAALPKPASLRFIDPENGARGEALDWRPDPLYGLLVTDDECFLYPPHPLKAGALARSDRCLYPGIPAQHSVFDLYYEPERRQLLIVDREAGDLRIFDTQSHQLGERIQIRPQGAKKAINLAIDGKRRRVLMTDNQSHMLYVLDLGTHHLDRIDIGMSGFALGNLALSPDGQHFYLLTLKPSVGLLYIHLPTSELIRQIAIKGELFSNGQHDFQDLLQLTPNQQHLLLMTYLDEPEPFTPIITVISTEKVKTLQRYALKDGAKPGLLAFAWHNALLDPQPTVLERLLAKGLITSQQLQSLEVVDLDDPDGPDHGQGKVPTLAPQEAEKISLSPELAAPVIVAALSDKLYQQTAIDAAHHPEALMTLEAVTEHVRQFLETHDSVEINLTVSGQHFNALITRQEILIQLEKMARARRPDVSPPASCPACGMALGSWDCSACDFELESPKRAARKAKCSLTPSAYVPQFSLLLADPKRHRLVMLDQNRTLEWQLEAGKLPCASPWSVQWLPNKHLLVLDKAGSQVYECTPTGQVKWRLDQKLSPELQLCQPVKVSFFADQTRELILIVDQGHHRVLAVDRAGKIHWKYGTKGRSGSQPGLLFEPSDLQWTFTGTCLIADTGNHRVIEVSLTDGSVIRIFGPELGLLTPTFAQRLLNHNTLIVDAGNYRVIELDENGDPVNECFYYKEEMGEAMRIDRPIHAIRGEKKNILLIDEDKMIELLPHKRRLIWSSLLEHLAHRVEIQDQGHEAGEQYASSFYQYRMPSMEQIIEMLKHREEQAGGLAKRLMDNFNRLLEIRRELDFQRAERSKVRYFHHPQLLDLPIWCVDRTHRMVYQLNRDGKPIWYYGSETEQRLLRPSHITQTETSLLIADTSNQRIIEVDLASRQIVLALGDKDSKLLNQPRSAFRTLAGNTLIADQTNRRLVELNAEGEVVWEFKNPVRISGPYFAAEQGTGTILYTDWVLQVVQEIRRDGTVIWTYGQSRRVGDGPNQLSCPEYAVRLPAGSTLIADSGNNRVLEVAPNRSILWQFSQSDDFPLDKPCYCKRLSDGNTLIAYDNYRQIVEVDKRGTPSWHFKLGNAPLLRPDL